MTSSSQFSSGKGRWLAEYHRELVRASELRSIPSMHDAIPEFETPWAQLQDFNACLIALEGMRREALEKLGGELRPSESTTERTEPTTQDVDAASGPLEHVCDPLRPARSDPSLNSAQVSKVPLSWGRFQIRRELGRGGQGIVFLAHDPHLNRDVALKIPLPEVVVTPESRARFLREAQTAARLDHPHLVTVYEAGENGPFCYMTTAYCPGTNLATWIREQSEPVPAQRAARLVATLADAVKYIHRRGIVHRDMKPANVILQQRPADEISQVAQAPQTLSPQRTVECVSIDPLGPELPFIPRLTDFGLAKLEDAGQEATRTGMVLGTPQYMAPEQADGRQPEAGPRTDIYGLGAILYELLGGHPPFPRGANELETLRLVMRETPTLLRVLRPDVPADLEAICQKAMSWDPAMRYSSAAGLADDLHRFLEGRPVLARPPGPWGRLQRWGRRNPVVAMLSGSLSCFLIVGLLTVTMLWQRATSHWETAEKQERQAVANFHQAQRAVRDFQEALYMGENYNDPAFQPMRKQLLETTLKYYQAFLDQSIDASWLRADIADAQYQLAFVHASLGAKNEAMRIYRGSLPLWKQLTAEQPSSNDYQYFLAKTLHNLAFLSHEEGELKQSGSWYVDSLEIWHTLVRENPNHVTYQTNLASTWLNLGALHATMGDKDLAMSQLGRAASICRRILTRDDSQAETRNQLATTMAKMGSVLTNLEKFGEAIEHYRKAQTLFTELIRREERLPSSARGLANTFQGLGDVHSKQGDQEKAIEYYREANQQLSLLVRDYPTLAQSKRHLASNCTSLATLHQAILDHDQAEHWYKQAGLLREELHAMDPASPGARKDLLHHSQRVGRFYLRTGRPFEAKSQFDRAAEVWFEAVSVNDRSTLLPYGEKLVQCHQQLARKLARGGKLEEAEEQRQIAAAIVERMRQADPDEKRYADWAATLDQEHREVVKRDDFLSHRQPAP